MGGVNSKNSEMKNGLESIYASVLNSQNVSKTIVQTHYKHLTNNIVPNMLNTINTNTINGTMNLLGISKIKDKENREELIEKITDFYVKKINLIGTIMNAVSLSHQFLERVQDGYICVYGKNKEVKIEPSIPFAIKINNEPIFLKTSHIKSERHCIKNGGIWIKIHTEKSEKWQEQSKKIENTIFEDINNLIQILDELVDECIESRLINDVETRVRCFKDRNITEKELENLVIKTKKKLTKLYQNLDSFYLICFATKGR